MVACGWCSLGSDQISVYEKLDPLDRAHIVRDDLDLHLSVFAELTFARRRCDHNGGLGWRDGVACGQSEQPDEQDRQSGLG
jgi:hypothetical protein